MARGDAFYDGAPAQSDQAQNNRGGLEVQVMFFDENKTSGRDKQDNPGQACGNRMDYWEATQLADTLFKKSKFKLALLEARNALLLARSEFGDHSHECIKSVESCARIYEGLRRYDRAFQLYRLAASLCEKGQSMGTLQARLLTQAGTVVALKGHRPDAHRLFARSIELFELHIGPQLLKHEPMYSATLCAAGQISQEIGHYSDAESYYLKFLALSALPEDSVAIQVKLAQTYLEVEKLESVIHILSPALVKLRSATGKDYDPLLLAQALWVQCVAYRDLFRYDDAIDSGIEALELFGEIFGDDDDRTLLCECTLASILIAQGELTEAEESLPTILPKLVQLIGNKNPELISPLAISAQLRQTQAIKARALLESCLRTSGYRHTSSVCEFLRAEGLASVAQRILLKGTDFVSVKDIRKTLLEAERGYLEEAKELYLRATKLCEEYYGSFHPDLAFMCEAIGDLCRILDQERESNEYLDKAAEIRKATSSQMNL